MSRDITLVDLKGQLSSPAPKLKKLVEAQDQERGVRIPVRIVRSKPPQVQRRLTSAEVDYLLTAYESGLPVKRLAELYKIHRTTVLSHLKRTGVPTRPNRRKLTDEQVRETAKLYVAG